MYVCDVCGEKFWDEPFRPMYFNEYKTLRRVDGIACSVECAMEFGRTRGRKKDKFRRKGE